jgi:molecular chaperone DnaJ
MAVKDYYKILELKPNAREDEIRKSFRRLALQYHPDVNNGEKHTDAWYREIQEAYEVLTDPHKKANYLQERWLLKSKGMEFEDTTPLTPEFIEMKFRSLRQSIANMDHFRMDHEKLKSEISGVCNDVRIDALVGHADSQINKKIIEHLTYCLEPLHYKYIDSFKPVLTRISGQSKENNTLVASWYRHRKRLHTWEKNQWWVILLITVAACGVIAFLTNQ